MKNGIFTDFHSHILPGADHGSDCVETSRKQLGIISSHGIKYAVATPHFYPTSDNVDTFLERRKACAERLRGALRDTDPEVYIGSEAHVCEGMEGMEGLDKLCVKGTRCILIEMPFVKWTDRLYETVDAIANGPLRPVIAHIDRYDPGMIEELMTLNVRAQLNPDPFYTRKGRKFADKWIGEGKVVAVGSDLHMANEEEYSFFAGVDEYLGGTAVIIERSMRELLEGAEKL
ncbi:MAG: hypothetical protein IJT70_05795 [Clostridia bacterium]|nr:hypothetical protein [Clostridia bacterium]